MLRLGNLLLNVIKRSLEAQIEAVNIAGSRAHVHSYFRFSLIHTAAKAYIQAQLHTCTHLNPF